MISLLGIFLILAFGWLISKDRSRINWRTISAGLILQAFLAFFILHTSSGQIIFSWLNKRVMQILSLADQGGEFAFGPLYNHPQFIFAFRVTPPIIFLSSLIAVLYYLKIMHPILKYTAWALQKIMQVSGAEALANIASAFVGQVESALPLRPYFSKLSQAQFFSIMVGGMSTMSAALLATYAGLGIPTEYLLTANLMGIPAGLITAKLIWPSSSSDIHILPEPKSPQASSLMDAAVQGAQEGLKISLAVIGMAIAFISLVAFVNSILNIFHLSLSQVLSLIFYPLSILLGVPSTEAPLIASLIGQKIALNEFVAYFDLVHKIALCPISERSLMIATFALCGFANFGSVAIQLGAFSQMLPEKRAEFAEIGLLSLVAGGLASLLSACWANLFFSL